MIEVRRNDRRGSPSSLGDQSQFSSSPIVLLALPLKHGSSGGLDPSSCPLRE